jgi:hypothetical protein
VLDLAAIVRYIRHCGFRQVPLCSASFELARKPPSAKVVPKPTQSAEPRFHISYLSEKLIGCVPRFVDTMFETRQLGIALHFEGV